jgi:DNA-binding response OmpR family regulator
MHIINVLLFGPENFNISLKELKAYLNFDISVSKIYLNDSQQKNFDILIFHQDFLENNILQEIEKSNKIKILLSNTKKENPNYFNEIISLPISVNDLNDIVENSIIKKSFIINSSIKIKNYTLDKNEKKLIKDKTFILLTEKEIQLLELFLTNEKPVNKNKILEVVWKYSKSADTHTVETHIYRLRKKIKDKFSDEKFILNNDEGYLL